MRPECKVAIVMGVSDPDAPRHARHSMILVPLDAPGVTIERSTTVFGYDDGPHGGHGVIDYDHVRVPAGEPARPAGRRLHDGAGPARSGPHPPLHARLGHGRAGAGADVRARRRAAPRSASRSPSRAWCASGSPSRGIAIDQARLLVLKAAWLIDTVGAQARAHRDRRDQGRGAARRAATSSTGRSRRTAPPASPATPRSPRCGRSCARCASPTGPTRCTCARSPGIELAAARGVGPPVPAAPADGPR